MDALKMVDEKLHFRHIILYEFGKEVSELQQKYLEGLFWIVPEHLE